MAPCTTSVEPGAHERGADAAPLLLGDHGERRKTETFGRGFSAADGHRAEGDMTDDLAPSLRHHGYSERIPATQRLDEDGFIRLSEGALDDAADRGDITRPFVTNPQSAALAHAPDRNVRTITRSV
jgi:hypothetical protein